MNNKWLSRLIIWKDTAICHSGRIRLSFIEQGTDYYYIQGYFWAVRRLSSVYVINWKGIINRLKHFIIACSVVQNTESRYISGLLCPNLPWRMGSNGLRYLDTVIRPTLIACPYRVLLHHWHLSGPAPSIARIACSKGNWHLFNRREIDPYPTIQQPSW